MGLPIGASYTGTVKGTSSVLEPENRSHLAGATANSSISHCSCSISSSGCINLLWPTLQEPSKSASVGSPRRRSRLLYYPHISNYTCMSISIQAYTYSIYPHVYTYTLYPLELSFPRQFFSNDVHNLLVFHTNPRRSDAVQNELRWGKMGQCGKRQIFEKFLDGTVGNKEVGRSMGAKRDIDKLLQYPFCPLFSGIYSISRQ